METVGGRGEGRGGGEEGGEGTENWERADLVGGGDGGGSEELLGWVKNFLTSSES